MPASAIDSLLTRHSMGIKYLSEPGPCAAELEQMVAAAMRAPDHASLVPWRLCVVQGPAREHLAQLFVEHATRKGKSAQDQALERERALKAPLTVAVIARIDLGHPLVPAHEQWMAVGGAVTNFLNAAHALGYAAKMLSGDKARAAHITHAFCGPGETLVGWVAVGTPVKALQERPRQSVSNVLQHWPAPG